MIALAMMFTVYTSAHASDSVGSNPKSLVSQTTQSNYYVSATGNDSNSGASSAPFKTIQKAANTVPTGSIVHVLGSTNERVTITRPGIDFECASAPCKMDGFAISASSITVNGFSIDNVPNISNGYGIYVTSTNCILTNNYITHGNWGGIGTSATSSGCLIKGNTLTYNSQTGLKILGANHVVQANDISHSIQNPSWTTNGVNADADGILFFGTKNTFIGNYIHDISYSDPGNTSPHIDCHQTWANNGNNASGIIFHGERCVLDNIVLSTAEASTCFTTQENTGLIVVENSLLDCTIGAFIKPATGGTISFNHNVIIGQTRQSSAYSFGVWSNGALGVGLANNIVYNFSGDSVFVKNGGSVNGNNNLFDDPYKNVTTTGYSPVKDLVNLDPKFDTNYYLQPGSPALGTASDGGDIGAFGPATNVPPPVPSVTPTTTYTPTALATSISSSTPTQIASPFPALPTFTSMPILPTATQTTSPIQVLPTFTPTAVQPTATPQPSLAITYDDKNSAFIYSSGWQTVPTTNAYNGSYKETTQDGASVVLPFTGQSFSIIYKGGPTFNKIDVFIDAVLVATLNEKLTTDTFQMRWDYPAQLTPGNHRLKLVFKVSSSTINLGSLDAVIIH